MVRNFGSAFVSLPMGFDESRNMDKILCATRYRSVLVEVLVSRCVCLLYARDEALIMGCIEKYNRHFILFVALLYIVFSFRITNAGIYWNDATWFSEWQRLVHVHGIVGAYIISNIMAKRAHFMPINYPPLYLYLLGYVPVPAIVLGLIAIIPCMWMVWSRFGSYNVFILLAMPVSIYDILVMGQIDYLFLFLVVMSIFYYEKQVVISGIMAGLCLLLKDEAVMFLPVFAVMAIKNRKFLVSIIVTWLIFFLPFYSNILIALKVSYLYNISIMKNMSFFSGNVWALLTSTVNLKRSAGYDLIGYCLSGVWAVYVFWYTFKAKDFLKSAYFMSFGFIFFPDRSIARDFVFPFFLAFVLYNTGQEKFKNSAYFFGFALLLSIMSLETGNSVIMLISVKILALANLFILARIVRDMSVPKGALNHSDMGDASC